MRVSIRLALLANLSLSLARSLAPLWATTNPCDPLLQVHWRQKGGPVHEISVDHAGPGLANIMWEIGTFMTMIRDGRQQDDVITWVRHFPGRFSPF